MPTTVYAMPPTNTAGWLARRAGEMPSVAAVVVSIIATCALASFSYAVSGEPDTRLRPIAVTAPGEAASSSVVWEAAADSASEPVKFVPSGRNTGHQTPAALTPPRCSAIASAPAGKPIGGLLPGGATLLAGPLSSTVTVVSSRTVNWWEIWPAPVAVRPSTATNAPTPRTVPSMVKAARPGRCTIPATASAVASRAVSRGRGRPAPGLRMPGPALPGPALLGPTLAGAALLGQHPVADRDPPAGVRGHRGVVGDHHDREARFVQLVEQIHDRGRVPRIQVPGRLVAQQQARPVHQRPRDRHPLALPAGQRGGQRVEPVAEPDRVQRIDRGPDPAAPRRLVV